MLGVSVFVTYLPFLHFILTLLYQYGHSIKVQSVLFGIYFQGGSRGSCGTYFSRKWRRHKYRRGVAKLQVAKPNLFGAHRARRMRNVWRLCLKESTAVAPLCSGRRVWIQPRDALYLSSIKRSEKAKKNLSCESPRNCRNMYTLLKNIYTPAF